MNFNVPHTELGRLLSCLLSGTLSGKRRALATSFEATCACTGPAKSIAFRVGDRHRCVIKRRVNVRDAA